MIREWLQWVAGGVGRPSTRRRRRFPVVENGETNSSSGGCMCAVFHQLFDLQHMHSLGNYQTDPARFIPEDQPATISKGVEAPRNSLELKESLSIKEKEDDSNFPVGINKIKTRVASESRTKDNNNNDNYYYSSDCSPGTSKTPNLVARLMGLDLLPESSNSSPSLSSISNSKAQSKNNRFSDDDIAIGARSSSAARRSDFEYHRLSLQINKENKNGDDFAISAKIRGKSAKSENSGPTGRFGKQIVNRVKEKANRRGFGLTDITNRERDGFSRRDQNLVLINQPIKNSGPKKKIVTSSGTKTKGPKNLTSSCEGGIYAYDQSQQGVFKGGKKIGGGDGNISSGLKKLQFGPRSCDYSIRERKLAKDKAKLTNKKKLGPHAAKLPQKQSSRNPSRSYKQLSLRPDQISTVLSDKDNGCTSATAVAFKDYVGKILKRAGINDKLTPITLGKWRTSSHPLDPSIFYYLELFYPGAAALGGALSRRSNRRLIFQLVDELLAEILKPHLGFKPWVESNANGTGHLGLCDELCEKIGDFPAADCRVLEDIDLLINRDLSKLNGGLEEEGEGLVCEIEGEIMEWLIRETVAVIGGGRGREAEEGKKKTESRQVSRAGDVCHVMRCY